MKSKAHMKKCLELGVSMSSVEDTEADEGGKDRHTRRRPVSQNSGQNTAPPTQAALEKETNILM